jgi:uncharacterized membrane protein
MDAYLLEWGSLLLRWLHVIAGMAWIGASFFFMHLDATLKPANGIAEGKGGAAWQVHGGGFYEMRKFMVAPDHLPAELTWHKWQSYWTWISGFLLLVWIYYAQAQLYLIDPTVMALEIWQAALIGIGGLAIGWIVYDLMCRSWIGENENRLALAGFFFVIAAATLFSLVFSGRGAMIHTGALLATIMTGNVFFIIIPNQKKSVAALLKGEAPDPRFAYQGKQRSTHNNYITLPVVFMMLANHYPVVWANNLTIPLIVAFVLIAGAFVRHFYNVRHRDHAKSPWWMWGVATAAVVAAFALAMLSSPAGRAQLGLAQRAIANPAIAGLRLPPEAVVTLVQGRCAMCHAPEPLWPGITIAPKGVMLDTPERIATQAHAIKVQAVLSHAMPPNHIVEVTAEERQVLAQWLRTMR